MGQRGGTPKLRRQERQRGGGVKKNEPESRGLSVREKEGPDIDIQSIYLSTYLPTYHRSMNVCVWADRLDTPVKEKTNDTRIFPGDFRKCELVGG